MRWLTSHWWIRGIVYRFVRSLEYFICENLARINQKSVRSHKTIRLYSQRTYTRFQLFNLYILFLIFIKRSSHAITVVSYTIINLIDEYLVCLQFFTGSNSFITSLKELDTSFHEPLILMIWWHYGLVNFIFIMLINFTFWILDLARFFDVGNVHTYWT